jgi:hypothetical protein
MKAPFINGLTSLFMYSSLSSWKGIISVSEKDLSATGLPFLSNTGFQLSSNSGFNTPTL